ncbi:glycosyl transferase family 2 [Enterococcus silesiacus]|uniref:Glycosyl transferase family 2 n=1 Tax=Enterococcus silesiacus TaxID=332949 RepID=A0ABM5WDS7_9ENTE|nr:glycosyl transferase family 2 [Enterococcus silesiacus]
MGLEVFLVENKLIITIVMYQTEFSQTPSYDYLKRIMTGKKSAYLLVYDNSKKAQEDELFCRENVRYIHDETNPGLAEAYNAGSQYLQELQGDLLLLLDQDTLIDEAYLETLLGLELVEEIGAYVPIISSHGRQISPVFSDRYVGGKSELPESGVYSQRIMSINSGTAIPQKTIQSIGQFSLDFPLDFLDHWLFWRIHQLGKKVYVLDHHLAHDLSVLDYRTIDSKRYDSIIQGETLFYQKYDQDKFYTHRRHLLLRTLKQFLRVKNRKIWRRTFLEYRSLLMKGK